MSNDYTETLITSRTAYQGKLLTLKEDQVKLPDGNSATREYVLHQGAAMVIALFDDFSILLERQFRFPARAHFLELPAGKIDPGEVPLATARRELLEETGYSAKKWVKLASFYPSPGYVGEKMNLFLALGLTEGKRELMEDERIETRWFSRKEIGEMIHAGKILDGKTIIGYFLWLDWLKHAARP